MAGNKTLELSIKIAGRVDKSLINAINAAQSNISSLSTTLSKVGTVGLAAMGTMATGTVAAIVKCTDAAKDFETQMGDVVKYVDGLADADGKISDKVWGYAENFDGNPIPRTYADNYAEMSAAILDLSTEIPYTAGELTRLAAAAGQSGKTMDDLVKGGFLKDVAKIGTAWDISADQAGDWAAKWEVAFDKSHEEIMTLADQINYLGAHNATTAAEIAQVVNEAAGLGQVAGMDVDATAALGTAMLAMGVDTAKAANSINRMYTNMSKGASATKAQKEMWQELGFTATGIASSMREDASGTMLKVFEAIQQLPEERQVAALSTLFGQWAITGAAKLTGNLDTFRQALSDIDNQDLFTGSMNREFVIKSETSEALDTRMKSALNAFQVDIGNAFLPAKKDISLAIIGFLDTIRNNKDLPRVAEMLASMFSTGLEKAGNALENAMPTIEKVLGYLADHGPQVLSFLGKLAAAFAAMKFAPGIESLLRGAGGLVFGSKTGGGTNTGSGGIVGLMGNLFKGGQNAARNAPGVISGVLDTARGVIGTAKIDAQLSGKSLLGTLFNTATYPLGNTKLGNAVKGTAGNVGRIVGGAGSLALGGLKGVGNTVLNPTSLLKPANLLSGIKSATPSIGNIVGGMAGMWGPIASGFGGLLSSALPIVGVISSIIAVVSILVDKFGGLEGIFNRIFGEEGPDKLKKFQDTITGLFDGSLIASAMKNLGKSIFGTFDPFTERYQGGLLSGVFSTETIDMLVGAFNAVTPILQSVMGVVGQMVTFANTTVKPIIQQIFQFITQTVLPIILQAFTSAAPIIAGIISNLGTAVMTVAQIIGTAIQAVLPIVEGLITVFMSIASVVIPILLGAFEGWSNGISAVMQVVQEIFQNLLTFISDVFTLNWGNLWQDAVNLFGSIFSGIGELVKGPINAVIGAINGIHVTAPDWPVLGDLAGKEFGFNIPMLAKGGFTNGPSIAGEAGTEAVISFQRSARASNIATWARAGQMLGVSNKTARLETFDTDDGRPGWPNGNGGGQFKIVYAPQIIIQGNASKDDIDAALRDDKARFKAWYEEMKRDERRTRY